jgi:uncharacterized protein (PEP-CTERM system associated)
MAITGTRRRTSVSGACAARARNVLPPCTYRILRQAAWVSLVAFVTAAQAETWRLEPWVNVEETLTNNVNLDSNSTRRGDFVSQITPGFRVRETGAHTSLAGFVSLPILLYARTGSDNNRVEPQVFLLGNWEAIDHFFFVESSINVNQEYVSPFGARSETLANATNNRFTSQTYRITPYIKGDTSDYSYELRDNNIWTKGDSSVVNGAYTNELVGTFQRDPRPLGYAFDVDRTDTKFQDQSKQLLELVRMRALYQFDPQVQLSASVGYEHNDLLLESQDNTIYGIGIKWRPSERSNVDASWEHRFFGASYNLAVANRSPLSVWSVTASRNITTYPQQLASLPGGSNVALVLDQLFLSRVPDAAQRQTLVNQLILDRGLPSFLSSGVNIYSQQVTLQESASAMVGLLGARNSVFGSVYRLRQEPITGSGAVVPALAGFTNNTQYGANLVWSHNLTPLLTLTGIIDGSRTVNNDQPGISKQGSIRATLTSPLSAQTDVYGGVRYQIFRSDINFDYDEAAVFVGINHRFH